MHVAASYLLQLYSMHSNFFIVISIVDSCGLLPLFVSLWAEARFLVASRQDGGMQGFLHSPKFFFSHWRDQHFAGGICGSLSEHARWGTHAWEPLCVRSAMTSCNYGGSDEGLSAFQDAGAVMLWLLL